MKNLIFLQILPLQLVFTRLIQQIWRLWKGLLSRTTRRFYHFIIYWSIYRLRHRVETLNVCYTLAKWAGWFSKISVQFLTADAKNFRFNNISCSKRNDIYLIMFFTVDEYNYQFTGWNLRGDRFSMREVIIVSFTLFGR